MVARILHALACLRHFRLVLGAFWVLLCFAAVSVADPSPRNPATAQPIHTYDLMPGVRAVVLDSGNLELHYESGGITHRLLAVDPAIRNVARGGEAKVFTGLFAEGVTGGQRGFAREADDDSDGLLDEDRADGIDNDGDGKLDEDFMAISDAMVVVHRSAAGRQLHLETYHWNYSHLRSSLAVSYRSTDSAQQSRDGIVTLRLPDTRWHQTDLPLPGRANRDNTVVRQDVIYVASIPHPDDPDRSLWVGVYSLSQGRRGQAAGPPRRVKLAGSVLDVPLQRGDADLAISIAPSLLQLRYNLVQMRAVHRGVPDMAGQGLVAWIVPPASLTYRGTTVPAVRWTPREPDGFRLVFQIEPGDNALFDPDRFFLDGHQLGPPAAVIWRSQDNQTLAQFVHPWADWSVTDLQGPSAADQDPYRLCPDLLNYAGSGDLIFEFAKRPEPTTGSVTAALSGQTLCGRSFAVELEPWVVADEQEPDSADGVMAKETENEDLLSKLEAANLVPTLNPNLLGNYPNPFQVQTSIKFMVPETVEEGFVWEEGVQPTLALESRIPYSSGQPMVTLKVYSLSGKEVATLFSGSLGTGEYHASWDGTDAWGRTVASGTYFCKLQVENWSVTKRLIFVR